MNLNGWDKPYSFHCCVTSMCHTFRSHYSMCNRPFSQIPQCTIPLSHNAPLCNRNGHISVTKWCIVGYFSDVLWELWDRSICNMANFLHILQALFTDTQWQCGSPDEYGWIYSLDQWGTTAEWCCNMVQYNKILHTSLQWWRKEYKSEIESTKNTPYLTLTGELWCIFCENLGENLPLYNGTTLHSI